MTWVLNFVFLLSLVWLAMSAAIAIIIVVAILTTDLIWHVRRGRKTHDVVLEAERILRERSR